MARGKHNKSGAICKRNCGQCGKKLHRDLLFKSHVWEDGEMVQMYWCKDREQCELNQRRKNATQT